MQIGAELHNLLIDSLLRQEYDSSMSNKPTKPKKFSDQIRQAIEECGMSRYRISKETDISEPTLSWFMSRQRGLTMNVLDILAEFLGLNITTGRKPKGTTGRKPKRGK